MKTFLHAASTLAAPGELISSADWKHLLGLLEAVRDDSQLPGDAQAMQHRAALLELAAVFEIDE